MKAVRRRAKISSETESYELSKVLAFMRTLWALVHGLRTTSKHMGSSLGVTGPQRLVILLAAGASFALCVTNQPQLFHWSVPEVLIIMAVASPRVIFVYCSTTRRVFPGSCWGLSRLVRLHRSHFHAKHHRSTRRMYLRVRGSQRRDRWGRSRSIQEGARLPFSDASFLRP
jgi:hypothetical protein